MAKKPRKRRDRYDSSGNVEVEYADEAQTVLVNLKDITDLETLQVAEEEALARAYETLLGEVRAGTPMTIELVRHIHQRIFGDLYAWAGNWRTVWISKPGVTWPPPDFLDQAMRDFEQTTLNKYPAPSLDADVAFCHAVAEIQGEFLVVHPFREGNARTIKVCTNLLAVQTGRPFLKYDQSEPAVVRYIAAAQAAFKKNYDPMVAVIQQALGEARQ
jgi:cell filamentation protein, protein adenylyltransferase